MATKLLLICLVTTMINTPRLETFLPQITEKEYRDLNMLHYTFLAHFAKSGLSAFSERESEIDAYKFGNLIDTMLTHPDDFVNRYYVSITEKQLTPSQETIVNDLVDTFGTTFSYLLEIPDENILDVVKIAGVYKNYGDDALLKAAKSDNCISEYACRVQGLGKIIISSALFDDAQRRISDLLQDERAQILFDSNIQNVNKNIEILYQSKFIDEEEKLKAMVDVLYIDHERQIIIPYDIKTSSMNTWDFNKAFIRFRYDIQADLYSYLIRKFISKHNEYLDYKVLPFTFIVLAPNGHVFAEYNPEESIDSQFYKENMNWRQLYEKAQWHISTGITNMTQETYENDGVLKLKL